MPVSNYVFWSKEQGSHLEEEGPMIPVEIGLPKAVEELLVKMNRPIPAPVTGYALIDTGASATGIHEPILKGFGLPPIDTIELYTPSGKSSAGIYMAKVSFPTLEVADVPMNRVIGSQLGTKTRSGKEMLMLLGRDVLKHFHMVYNGTFDQITLSF